MIHQFAATVRPKHSHLESFKAHKTLIQLTKMNGKILKKVSRHEILNFGSCRVI